MKLRWIYLKLNLSFLLNLKCSSSKRVFFRKTTPPPSSLTHYALFEDWRRSSRYTTNVGCVGQISSMFSVQRNTDAPFSQPKILFFYAMYSVGFLIEGTHHAFAAIGVDVLCFESLSERLRQLGAKTIKLTLSIRLVLIPRESKHDFLLKIE